MKMPRPTFGTRPALASRMLRKSTLLALLLAIPTLSTADAAPTRAPRAARPAPARTRTAPPRRTANTAQVSAALKQKYQRAVASKLKEMKKWVWDQATASYTETVFHPSVTVRTLREDAYEPSKGLNHSKLLKVSGPGIDAQGGVELTVLNNVSAHDLYSQGMSEAQYQQRVNARIAGDLMRVSIRYPSGRTEIIQDRVPTKDVTAVPIKVRLEKGINEIRVDRLNQYGSVVGSAGMLGGRRVEVQWDGPSAP